LHGAPAMTGYEIHQGISTGLALEHPALHLADGRSDGASVAILTNCNVHRVA